MFLSKFLIISIYKDRSISCPRARLKAAIALSGVNPSCSTMYLRIRNGSTVTELINIKHSYKNTIIFNKAYNLNFASIKLTFSRIIQFYLTHGCSAWQVSCLKRKKTNKQTNQNLSLTKQEKLLNKTDRPGSKGKYRWLWTLFICEKKSQIKCKN